MPDDTTRKAAFTDWCGRSIGFATAREMLAARNAWTAGAAWQGEQDRAAYWRLDEEAHQMAWKIDRLEADLREARFERDVEAGLHAKKGKRIRELEAALAECREFLQEQCVDNCGRCGEAAEAILARTTPEAEA